MYKQLFPQSLLPDASSMLVQATVAVVYDMANFVEIEVDIASFASLSAHPDNHKNSDTCVATIKAPEADILALTGAPTFEELDDKVFSFTLCAKDTGRFNIKVYKNLEDLEPEIYAIT